MFDNPITIDFPSSEDAPAELDELLAYLRNHGPSGLDAYPLQKTFPAVKQEPVTIAVAVVAGTPALVKSLARVLERWLAEREQTRQKGLDVVAAKASADPRANLRITVRRGFTKDELTLEEFSHTADNSRGGGEEPSP